MRPVARSVLAAAALLAVTPAAAATTSEAKAPDLLLEWVEEGSRRAGEPIRGPAGETVRLPYRLRNVGEEDAFACLLEATESGGAIISRQRLQPGPRAGSVERRELRLALAPGMSEICLEARLQTVRSSDAQDPEPGDNRICLSVEIVEETWQVERAAPSRPLPAAPGGSSGAPRVAPVGWLSQAPQPVSLGDPIGFGLDPGALDSSPVRGSGPRPDLQGSSAQEHRDPP